MNDIRKVMECFKDCFHKRNMSKTPRQWLELFQRLNRDSARDGELVVPFSDVEFYTDQIYNITGEEDLAYAQRMAHELARR